MKGNRLNWKIRISPKDAAMHNQSTLVWYSNHVITDKNLLVQESLWRRFNFIHNTKSTTQR